MASITRENIITALEARGFQAQLADIEKNGVICKGIQFCIKPVAPVIYTDEIIKEAEAKGLSIDAVTDSIINIYEAHKNVNIDPVELLTSDYIMDHVKIGLQRKTGEKIIKRTCPLDENIEEYLYIIIDLGEGIGSAKVKPDLLKAAGIDLGDIWTRAEENTFKDITVEDMSVVLRAFGVDTPENSTGMYVISNHERSRGAAAILNKKALAGIAKKHGSKKLVVIPSSIHECIVLPYVESYNIDDICNMVIEINKAEVDPTEQLADRAYIVEV